MATLKVDYENNAERWWYAAQQLAESGRNPTFTRILNALTQADEIGEDVMRGELDAFLAAAAELPDWGNGPRHAPNPLLFSND